MDNEGVMSNIVSIVIVVFFVVDDDVDDDGVVDDVDNCLNIFNLN